MLERIKALSELPGVSGDEGAVRRYIRSQLEGLAELRQDTMGNLYAHKPGAGPKVAVFAHMDEPGFLIREILGSGFLRYEQCGLEPQTVVAKRVAIGPGRVPGVTGAKAMHLSDKRTLTQKMDHSAVYIDIGVDNKEEAEQLVSVGDYACFDAACESFGDGLVKGKALGSRVGCAIAMELLKEDLDCDFTAVFTVQHELGHRGAMAAAANLKPDFVIVLDGVIANELPETASHSELARLGEGTVISFMDGRSVVPEEIVRSLVAAAEAHGLRYQFKRGTEGTTDMDVMHKMLSGIRTGNLLIPCRYGNTPAGLMSLADIESCRALVKAYVKGGYYKEATQHV